jgi:hypothetical protein
MIRVAFSREGSATAETGIIGTQRPRKDWLLTDARIAYYVYYPLSLFCFTKSMLAVAHQFGSSTGEPPERTQDWIKLWGKVKASIEQTPMRSKNNKRRQPWRKHQPSPPKFWC